jgi:protein O-mannosyl-transferase
MPPDEPAPQSCHPAPPAGEPVVEKTGPLVIGDIEEPKIPGLIDGIRDYFLGDDPTFGVAVVPFCFLSMALFTRHPFKTNFIFDEQEALLANPYVRSVADPVSKLHWLDAFRRDFWGLASDRSIGSYRPIPDLVWRVLWGIGARDQSPFLHHWVNVLLHGVNGALVTLIAFKLTKDRLTAWLSGTAFVACAVLTEAVSGVVGIADVLGALGALLALMALAMQLRWLPLAVFAATLFGLFSKESALVCVPLVPFAALMTAQLTHPERPLRWVRCGVAALSTVAAFVLYVETRRRLFPAPIQPDFSVAANVDKPALARAYAAALRWYAQPTLPRDPLNNPLIDASGPYRIAAALRVYVRGLSQIVFPWTLSGDYSAPQEPIPDRLVFPESVLGGLLGIVPIVASLVLGVLGWLRWRTTLTSPASKETGAHGMAPPVDLRPIIGVALMWIVVSYFPVSNIPVLLPTVRAERFWYFPAIGTSLLLGMAFRALLAWGRREHAFGAVVAFVLVFFSFQCFAARRHAMDYTDDLAFWDATRHAVPRSAKGHLNYSVMQGARGHLDIRLESNRIALELAPKWPMANIYLGDTLCRLHRTAEAWPYYASGFELAPNDVNLVSLGVQCLWDEKALGEDSAMRAELVALGEKHPGSWLEYIERDVVDNGEEHDGVDPKYRPRGYNQGPKD